MNEHSDSSPSVTTMPPTPLSQLLEAVVTDQGLTYWRLQQDLLVVAHDDNELIFASLAGPSVTTFSDRLASNQAMLCRHLKRHEIPAQEAIMVPAGGYDHAARFAETHDGALTARWEMLPDSTVELAADSFYRDWNAFVAEQPDHAGEVILQPTPPNNQVDVAVAFGESEASPSASDQENLSEAEHLAVTALSTLPHAAYGLVTIDLDELRVSGIDLTFRSWNHDKRPANARHVATLILEGELHKIGATILSTRAT